MSVKVRKGDARDERASKKAKQHELAIEIVEKPPSAPDVWSRRFVSFPTIAAGHAALQDAGLLAPFFERWGEVTKALEVACAGVDTNLCRNVMKTKKISVLVYGEAGAGKSTLVRALTGDENLTAVSATGPGTVAETTLELPCGLCLVDTPGFRVPLPLRTAATPNATPAIPQGSIGGVNTGSWYSLTWLREWLAWRSMLRGLRSRVTSQDPTRRPFGLIYCHRAGERILRDRVVELLRLPHQKLVPVFVVLTDVCNADDDDLGVIRAEWESIRDEVGCNATGTKIPLVEVNSHAKTVRGHTHRQTGVKELMAMLLNSLDPLDALTFARMPGAFSFRRRTVVREEGSRKRKR